MASPVTDPELLKRLSAKAQNPVLAMYDNGAQPTGDFTQTLENPPQAPAAAPAAAPQRKAVADPSLVQRLDQKRMAPRDAAPTTGAGSTMVGKAFSAIGDNPVSAGIKEGLTNRGIGVIQTVYEGMKGLGLTDSPEMEQAFLKAAAANHAAAKGTGVGGAVGEIVGDPINWIGGGAVGGATIKGLGKAAAIKTLAKQGGRAGAITGAASGATDVRQPGETRIGNTANNAAIGGATGAALPTGARAFGITGRGTTTAAGDIIAAGRSGTGRTPEQLQEAIDAMGDQADHFFTSMRQNNVPLTTQGRTTMAKMANDAFKNDRLDATVHPETTTIMRDLMDQLQNGVPDAVNPATRAPFDATAFDMIRRRLVNAKGQDGAQAGKLRTALFDAVQQPGALDGSPAVLDDLSLALQQWQKKARFEDIANLANTANNDPNRIRTVVDKFTDKAKNTRGMPTNEIDALTRAGQKNVGERALGLAGSLGINMGSISRNPNALVPLLMATTKSAAQGGAGYAVGGPVPVVVGTVANSVRNRIANGKLEKALREVEKRPVAVPARPPAAPVTPPTLQLTGPTAPLAIAPPQPVIIPGGPGGALRPMTAEERAVHYAQQQAPQPELEVPAAGIPRAPSTVQQQANDSVRNQYQDMSLTPDVLRTQRTNQVSAAEAQKAMQDAAGVPGMDIGQMLTESQVAARNRGQQLGGVGQALLDALKSSQGI